MSTPVLLISKITAEANMPTRGTAGSVGYDLYASSDEIIPSMAHYGIHTGIRIKIPHGHYGRIAPRSGLAFRHGINVLAGVIDPDYRGEVVVILHNTGSSDFTVNIGDRIAQLILEKCSVVPVCDIPNEDLDSYFEQDIIVGDERGDGGFGSTGV